MLVTMRGGKVEGIMLDHPGKPKQHRIPISTGKRLLGVCRVIGSTDYYTAVLGYDQGYENENI